MSKRMIATIVGALAVVALLAGCGGGDDGGGSDTAEGGGADNGAPALSKAEFIEQGDEICSEAKAGLEEDVEAYVEENLAGGSPSEEQEEGLVTEVVLPVYQALAEDLGALGAPEGEEADVEEIVTGIEGVVADGEADPSGVIGTDDPFAEVNEKATEFGFEVCGEP